MVGRDEKFFRHWGIVESAEDATGAPSHSTPERRSDALESALDVPHDERCLDANHAISSALERRIAAGVCDCALTVIVTIDLNHETLRGSQEVCNEPPEQRNLPAKEHAQATPANASPKELFRSSR